MQIAPLPPDEDVRIAALRRYEILDSAPEEAFERITKLAQRLFDVPIALVSLVDVDRQWFKSCIGLDTRSTSRDVSFCAHAILGDDVLVVPDATLDPRFSGNPDVLGGPGIRFYAGAPLQTAEGVSLGTLCVIDDHPRPGLSARDRQTLTDLARIVVDEMELRLSLRRSVEREEELRRAKAAAEQASAAKSQFLSRMSHEFRTPLNAILGFVQLLQGEDLTPDQKEDLAHMRRAGDQLLHLLTETLDLSRLESGKVRLTIEDTALAPVVAAAVRVAVGEERARVALDEGLRVLADVHQLEDVIAELIGNALTHAGTSATVTVTAERRGGVVDVLIADDGRGMETADLERLLAPFERGTGDTPGIGIGLALAQRTLEAMAGSLGVRSAPGEGTTLTISLPAGTGSAESGDGGPRILYVDDNPSSLRLVEKIMSRHPGVRLHLASTGAEGISIATEELPDLVLLDLYLPDASGFEVLESLRNDPRTASIPVVVVTVEDDPDVAARLSSAGAAEVLTKPFEAQTLVDAVTAHLDPERAAIDA
ncbi:MAG TPA: response regulator [Actinomycetota bacterium]|nr:response regulator [Actinomycetota bacterium]